MRTQCAIFIGIGLFAALGCSRVQHSFHPYQPVGTALSVEVAVKHKDSEPVSGIVYHRMTGAGAYQATPMQLRAGQLWALLPTEDLQSQDTAEYYIDVNKARRQYALGSPGSPFVVTFMDQAGMILSSLRDKPFATDTAHEVRIVLQGANQLVDQPTAVYQIPGVPGEIRAPMEADGYGNFQILIPPHAVRAGTWKYAIEISLNGEIIRMPQQGYQSFFVQPARTHEVAVEHTP